MQKAVIKFDPTGTAFTVALTLIKFPNGGSWSRFLCPQCNSSINVLRLLDGQPMCRGCCRERGVRYKAEPMRGVNRSIHRIPKLIEQLNKPARLNPRVGRSLDRRQHFELSLRHHLLVLREKNARLMHEALADVIADTPLDGRDPT
jgi:hypothetical protein